MDRKESKEQEFKYLAQEFKKNPELFARETHVHTPEFLEKIGISFPDHIRKNIFNGYLKLWPQDFIVEEVLKDNTIQTVAMAEFSKKETDPEDAPTLYTTLVKCGLSTIEAVEEISSALGIDKQKIQYAGIKDKDALTSQLISFRGVDKNKVENLKSPYYFLKDAFLGKGVVEKGGLKGNKFTILVRTNESFKKEKFLENLEGVKREGFLNFFYSQRFGSPRFINWFWGLLILKGEYEKAIMSFLCSEGQKETQYFKNLRKEIKKHFGDWQKISDLIKPFPIILQVETKVINHLKNNPTDFIGALNQISEQMELWIYAYSSMLFNRKISQYLQEGKLLPQKLPIIPSLDKNDWAIYEDFLKEDSIITMPFENLKPFKSIQWKKREILTREKIEIHDIKIIPEGAIINFTLPKGCYATSFLSNLFQIAFGMPPNDISSTIINTKELLGQENIQATLEKFKPIAFAKTENLFEKFD